MTSLQEISLIAQCVAADDRRAFGELVDHYSTPLRRFLLGLVGGDEALADDLAQETFLKAYLAIRSLEGVTRFKTWLFRIAYREFLTHLRRERPTESIDLVDLAEDEPDEPAVSHSSLAEAIMSLPEAQRAAVQLFYYEDFSIARIAAITGRPQGTIKVYLSRARSRLASLLEKKHR
ncbi:MAG: sigma-70 family RNA polymerase sigma factor [Pseudoflavonifractor sp.]|nr:sigma-70 family RNA polymerase sigma factor [Alloprevotella sp.]MCM1117462.1 sigma-70 family RNA polymerase sigma factor [Pseudoflavonifractor sp.]